MADAFLRAADGLESSRREEWDAGLDALTDDAAVTAALAEFDARLTAFQAAVLEAQAEWLESQSNVAAHAVSPTDAWGQILQHDARVDDADADDAPASRGELSADAEQQAVLDQAALAADERPVGASDCVTPGQIMANPAAPSPPGDFIADNDESLLCQLDVGLANAIRVRRRLTMKSIRELLAEQPAACAMPRAAATVEAAGSPRKRAWWRLGL